MRYISPGNIEGELSAPHSKSVFQRSAAAAVLADGKSVIHASHLCADDEAALRAATAMGVLVENHGDRIEITGPPSPGGGTVDCGESGLTLRTFAAVASLFDCDFELNAEGSLSRRPVDMVTAPLTLLGAKCTANAGLPPLSIRGPIRGGKVEVDGSVSSQFVTGLMIALPRCDGDSEVLAPGLRSKPYVKLTISLLEKFGIAIEADEDLERFTIQGGQEYRPTDITIEGDWSGAAFMLVAGATAGRVVLTGLHSDSAQPDRRIIDALVRCGANVSVTRETVSTVKNGLRAFEFDATDCPDLFPPLAALALSCEGTTKIRGAKRLKHKESDRGAALIAEFAKLGARIEIEDDTMRITGGPLTGGSVHSHGDHRIAMALAVAALSAGGDVEIEGDDCVNKSYPSFFNELKELGARIR